MGSSKSHLLLFTLLFSSFSYGIGPGFVGNCSQMPSPSFLCEDDFSGDGKEDVIFFNPDSGELTVMEFDGVNEVINDTNLPAILPGTEVLAVEDYNAAAFGENNGIYFYNPIFGQLAYWGMDHLDVVNSHIIGYLPPNSTVHIGDTNGDNNPDFVFEYYHLTLVTLSNRDKLTGNRILLNRNTGKILALADFDGDGDSDILYRENDEIIGMTVENNKVISEIIIAGDPENWKFKGIGDFNNDNIPDLVFDNLDFSKVGFILMGLNFEILNDVSYEINENSEVIAIADIDNDKNSDIIVRSLHNPGQIDVMLFENGQLKDSVDKVGYKDISFMTTP